MRIYYFFPPDRGKFMRIYVKKLRKKEKKLGYPQIRAHQFSAGPFNDGPHATRVDKASLLSTAPAASAAAKQATQQQHQ
jgi:hypothetical protein